MPDTKNYQKLRIFLASPSDVAKEREAVRALEKELNQSGSGVADDRGIQFEVIGYDSHVSPDMGRPQGVTFDQLPPESWDIFIGILWQRFGSPTGEIDPQTGKEFESGSIEEFSRAYELWKQHGAPRILFYRSKQPVNVFDLKPDQIQALQKVEAFFAQFGPNANHPGYYRTYQTPEDFEKAVRQDLQQFLLAYKKEDRQPLPPAEKPSVPNESDEALQRRYLQKLQGYCDLLPLAAVDEKTDSSSGTRLTLSQVYINLNTTDFVDETGKVVTHEMHAQRQAAAREEKEKLQAYTALQAAAQHPALVILGDPGSGKSSFLNHLMFVLAAKRLQPEYALPPDWPHPAWAGLLPVRVLLRELAVSLEKKGAKNFLSLGTESRRRELSRVVYEHIAEHLADYDAPDFAQALKTAMANGNCLLVFDGLDEAATSQRPLVRLAVEEFCASHPDNRALLTCRIRSYEGKACLESFKTVTLAPFDDQQIAGFIAHWYEALPQKFNAEQAAAKKADLQEAVRRLPQDLVRNPLLLTTLANMHTNSLELPRQRIKLYKNASALLLQRWQAHKAGKVSLIEALGLQSDKEIYRALWELGYFAQQSERGQAAADIPQAEAINILTRHFAQLDKPLIAASEFLDFVDQTAGLLIGRGGAAGNVYAFPHRTFQEYFAGCHLAKGSRNFKSELLKLLAEGDYWRLTAQLGIEEFLYNDNNDGAAMDVAYWLCPLHELQPHDEKAWRGVLWAGHFALEIGAARIAQDELPEGGAEFLERLRQRLIRIFTENLLPPRERADAGFVLGPLGDPREGVCTLPPLWVELEGGTFRMGSDEGEDREKPPHEVELSPFKISKYPITNAQFEMFMNGGGYQNEKWWSNDGWDYRQKENWEEPRLWRNENLNLPNQPVVGVSWFEAEAFCAWLTEKSKEQKENGKQIVRLPAEAEWEFAARGKDGRKFPWGNDEPTPEHANYGKMINRPTAIGIYSRGVTPEGIFDLAGNVWEWCLDWYDEKYYAECKKKGVVKDSRGPEKGALRVQRGGSYYSQPEALRGGLRLMNYPYVRLDAYGFRVCVAGAS